MDPGLFTARQATRPWPIEGLHAFETKLPFQRANTLDSPGQPSCVLRPSAPGICINVPASSHRSALLSLAGGSGLSCPVSHLDASLVERPTPKLLAFVFRPVRLETVALIRDRHGGLHRWTGCLHCALWRWHRTMSLSTYISTWRHRSLDHHPKTFILPLAFLQLLQPSLLPSWTSFF